MSQQKVITFRRLVGEASSVCPASDIQDRCDDDLMLLVKGGKTQAFDVLVQRHQRYVLTLTNKYLADQALARDAAQTSFVELFRFVPRYAAQGKFRQLLTRIVLNQCRMAGRSGATRRAVLSRFTHESASTTPTLQDERIVEQERQKLVDSALARLSAKLRAVTILRFCGELSYAEISQTLKIPVGTVKSRLAASMEELKKLLVVES